MKEKSFIKKFLQEKFSKKKKTTFVVPQFSPFLTSEFDLEALEKVKKIYGEE